MPDNFITREEFESRMGEIRDDVKSIRQDISSINNKLDQAKDLKLTAIKDLILAVIAGGGLTAIVELLVRR